MNSIDSVSSTGKQGVNSRVSEDFQALGSALHAGDLVTAQSELASFQQALQTVTKSSSSQLFGLNSQANADFQNLSSALSAGNLASAQKDFTSLQNDLRSPQFAVKGHHLHHGSITGSPGTAA
jgi:hypothetical protein